MTAVTSTENALPLSAGPGSPDVAQPRSRGEDVGLRSVPLSAKDPSSLDRSRSSLDKSRSSLDQPRTSFDRSRTSFDRSRTSFDRGSRRRRSVDVNDDNEESAPAPPSLRASTSPSLPRFQHTYEPEAVKARLRSTSLQADAHSTFLSSFPVQQSSSATASLSSSSSPVSVRASLSSSSSSSTSSRTSTSSAASSRAASSSSSSSSFTNSPRVRYSQKTASSVIRSTGKQGTRTAPATGSSSSSGSGAVRSKEGPIMIENFWGVKEAYYTMAQVAAHNKPDDCWLILDGKVYDATKVIPLHPGGAQSILNYAGKDASYHLQFHSSAMMKIIEPFFKGKLLRPEDEERCQIL